MRGADLLVEALKAAGVTRIYSLSGNQIMPVYDACFEAGVEIVHTRHEAAAVYMAEAHAQLTGTVGVAMVTAGAGAANALGPLFTASESETPVLLLTGDSPVSQDGRGAFQEMDQVPMTAPLTKLSLRPRSAGLLGSAVAKAVRTATSGRPGPVHIALPFDVVEDDAGEASIPTVHELARDTMALREGDARLITQAIAAAQKPVVLCGPVMNATRSGDLKGKLQKALCAPVIAMESPRGLKDPSLGALAEILQEADLVVTLGKRVDFTLGFGKLGAFNPSTLWISIQPDMKERDCAHLNLGKRLKMNFHADPRDAAETLIQFATGGDRPSQWLGDVADKLTRRAAPPKSSGRITPDELCAAVQRRIDAADDAIFISDGGEFGQWAQACITAKRRVVNGVSGAIGGGLCYGLAAARLFPQSTIFSMMGDGTAGFHLSELETAARVGAPYVLVIGNDMRWNAEHQIQLRDYGPDRLIGCELSDGRYDLVATALGGHGEFVRELSELDGALERAVNSGKVACVNVLIEGFPAPSGPSH